MFLDSPRVTRLIDAFRRMPGVGRRSAERMALHLLSAPEEIAYELSASLREARAAIRWCSVCNHLTETDPCPVCADERRDHGLVCVVEQPFAVIAIEKGGSFNGVYHVLHGVLSPLDGIGPAELKLDRLFRRVESGTVREVVLATNTTPEGEATALFLSRQIADRGVAVSRIAHGVPMGGGLEFADEATLTQAIHGRIKF
jgi:recombination protein RecR